jgi:hypothetical protein
MAFDIVHHCALNVNAVQIVHKDGKENTKNSIKNYQNFVLQFHDRKFIFGNPGICSQTLGFTEHSLNAVNKLKTSELDGTMQFQIVL